MTKLIALFVWGVAHAASPLTRPSNDNLEQVFAAQRRAQVEHVDYEMSFTLNKGSEEYQGKTIIRLGMARTDWPLSIDYSGKKITSLKVNGTTLTKFTQRKGSFDIPAKLLTKNTVVEVSHQSVFNKEGYGFQRSVDPEDKAEYLFSDFEPYYAHHLFPCLDQPDIKATYLVSVNAPSDWTIVANELVTEKIAEGDRSVTKFAKTPPLSPYLVFLAAGPWYEWKDKAGLTPVYLYARQSLAKYVDADRIHDTVRKGLKFFGDYFGRPYPFSKYGQIFVPEFAWGGMENPGAVALNERNIYRGPVTDDRKEGRDSLILHEMAHMWFGDLVTMKWWDDLWLNESFASYLASVAQSRATSAKGTWEAFFGNKTWGYWQDQLVTTHPIEAKVQDIHTVKGNFDGITYAKGASALQQLHFFVGEDAFREGLRSYFQEFAFKNTIRADFVNKIAAAAQKDLGPWTKAWLQTAGPNRVEAEWACADGKVSSFVIKQAPSVSKTLSPHRTRIGLMKVSASDFSIEHTQDVTYTAERTEVPEIVGQDCPDFVYPNMDNQDYALFSLDPVSLKKAGEVLTSDDSSPLLRAMLWNTLAQMVRDVKLPLMEYFDFVFMGLPQEKSESLLGQIIGRRSTIRGQYKGLATVKERAALAPRLEALTWARVENEKAGSDLQMMFYDFFVSIVQTPEGLAKIKANLDGQSVPKGLVVDQDRRWNILVALAYNGFAGAAQLVEAEKTRDPSTSGQRSAYMAAVAIPDKKAKDKFWQEFRSADRKIPRSFLESASDRFHNINRPELSEPFVEPFFSAVAKVNWKDNDDLTDLYFWNLLPTSLCTRTFLKQSQAQLASVKGLSVLARRAWREANDELGRCVAVRKL